jgi:hypothetical protein
MEARSLVMRREMELCGFGLFSSARHAAKASTTQVATSSAQSPQRNNLVRVAGAL